MAEPTDNTIEILCEECDSGYQKRYEVGVQAMFEHILAEHPHYNQYEADVYALKWMEAAFDEYDIAKEAYEIAIDKP